MLITSEALVVHSLFMCAQQWYFTYVYATIFVRGILNNNWRWKNV